MGFDPDTLERRDPRAIRAVLPALELVNRAYLRLGVEAQVPDTQALFVANHNGGIMGPDLACTAATLQPDDTAARALAHFLG